MDEGRRRQLGQELLRLSKRYADRYDAYSCGMALAEYISPELSRWGQRIRAIEAEVRAAMEEERA